MEYKTRQWHEKCFCCCVCKTAIGTKSFIPREQEIYCAGCYEEKYATRCIKCKKVSWSSSLDQNRRRFVTVWRLSRRSSPAAVWPTRTNRGTVSASRAPTARCRWPASASPAATRSRTVPIASGSCSPRDAPPVSSQLPVSLPFWAHFSSVLPLALLNCQKVWGYANVLPSFFRTRNRWYPFHLVRGPPLAQRLLHLRDLQDVAGRTRFHHRRAGRHLSGVRQAETDVNCKCGDAKQKQQIKTKHRLTKKHNEQQQQNDILKDAC